uniref:Solute carrier family 39 member 3 n=1 Tax=Felis catus TaxID=9685 RepID=A0ABI7Y8I8_FELCA
MMKLLVAKVLCMVGVFFFMLLGSLLPVKIIETDFEKAHRSKKILSLCNTFGGGVFLATCFNALLPAVREKELSCCLKPDTRTPNAQALQKGKHLFPATTPTRGR